ncbi:hypothetical protein HDU85_004230 [Gaertneriomyces sp. JEL0708]|nr:hypothetical protein HDU85_004230 [Gaertneriomyces sp. JEL0708]
MMELPCYIDYCVEAESDIKRGQQISHHVFYAWMLLLAFAVYVSRRKSGLRRFLHQPMSLPWNKAVALPITNGEALFYGYLMGLVAFNFGFWWPIYWSHGSSHAPERFKSYFTAQLTGRLLDFPMGLVILGASKNTFFQTLLGVSFDSTLRAHRWIGYWIWWMTWTHTGAYIWSIAVDPTRSMVSRLFNVPEDRTRAKGKDHSEWGVGNWLVPLGLLGLVFLTPVFITSLNYVRRRWFNVFYFSHFLVFPFLIFAWLHATTDFYYMIPGLGMYLVDVFLRYRAFKAPYKVAKAAYDGETGYVRVDLDLAEPLHYRGGQYIFVCFPDLAKHEWHPYSLISTPGAVVHSILLDPTDKRPSEWTRLVGDRLLKGDKENTRVCIEGPFGKPAFRVSEQEVIVCFVAGTGLAPALGIAREAWYSTGHPRVIIHWSVRQSGLSAQTASSLLCELAGECPNVSFVLYQTAHAVIPADEESAISAATGRVDFAHALDRAVDERTSTDATRVGVFICGGAAFTKDARTASVVFARRKSDVLVEIQEETFEF